MSRRTMTARQVAMIGIGVWLITLTVALAAGCDRKDSAGKQDEPRQAEEKAPMSTREGGTGSTSGRSGHANGHVAPAAGEAPTTSTAPSHPWEPGDMVFPADVPKQGPLLPVNPMTGGAGYITRMGKVVVPLEFAYAGGFKDGYAMIVHKTFALNGVLVDRSGKVAVVLDYWLQYGPLRLSEGIFRTEQKRATWSDRIYGYATVDGRTVAKPQFERAEPFSDGLALVAVGESIKWGYIDKSGKLVIPPRFLYAQSFSEGLAKVTENTPEGRVQGYIDKQGNWAIRLDDPYSPGSRFSEGLAVRVTYKRDRPPPLPSVVRSDKCGFIDKSGRIVIEPKFDWAMPFTEGLARFAQIADKKEKWGYIDKTGKVVVSPQYADARPFSDGLAAVRVGDKWGYIDKSGEFVITPRFSAAASFSDGVAVVLNRVRGRDGRETHEHGYIDTSGRYIWRAADGILATYIRRE